MLLAPRRERDDRTSRFTRPCRRCSRRRSRCGSSPTIDGVMQFSLDQTRTARCSPSTASTQPATCSSIPPRARSSRRCTTELQPGEGGLSFAPSGTMLAVVVQDRPDADGPAVQLLRGAGRASRGFSRRTCRLVSPARPCTERAMAAARSTSIPPRVRGSSCGTSPPAAHRGRSDPASSSGSFLQPIPSSSSTVGTLALDIVDAADGGLVRRDRDARRRRVRRLRPRSGRAASSRWCHPAAVGSTSSI